MKTLTSFIICALLAATQAIASMPDVDDTADVMLVTGPVIVCTINQNINPSYTSGAQSETYTCTCTEVRKAPSISVAANPVSKMLTVTGATQGDQIYILSKKGEILMHVEAMCDDPKIDVSALAPGSYTIGVQSY